ncbi:MAG: tetratricopeptide repeat protein [Verrucomicrobiota bacterium]
MAFTETKFADLPTPLRRTYDRAREAAEKKNYAYAFEMLRGILKKMPGCLEVRETLRETQMKRAKGKADWMLQLSAWPAVLIGVYIKGPLLLKKGQVAEAMDLAEGLMTKNPKLLPTVLFLARAAESAGLDKVAIRTLEHGHEHNPKSIELLQRQLSVYQRLGDDQNALRILQEMCELKPDDLALNNQMKQASASAAMQKGKWNQADSYRDVIKDKDEARELEDKQQLTIRDEDTLARRIQAAEQAVEKDTSAGKLRQLGDLYAQAKQYDQALDMYNRVIEVSGSMDPVIDKAITKVLAAQFDDAIQEWRTVAEQEPDRKEEANREIERLLSEKEEKLFQRVEERVKRYPNDAEYRFEYGLALYERDRFDEAMKQFQSAQRNPRYRRSSQLHVGKCMAAKGMLEMACEQFETALAEAKEMDDDRKEILYSLALVQEAQGNTDAYIKYLKEIYAADANYEDVEDRIQKYYADK